MNKIISLLIVVLFVACSSDDNDNDRTMYDVTYTVTATNGTTLNKVEYRNDKGVLVELTNVSAPWSVNLKVRAGLGLEAAAYGDIPYQGVLSITARWTPEGGNAQSENETLPNNTENSVITNGVVRIEGRTLTD